MHAAQRQHAELANFVSEQHDFLAENSFFLRLALQLVGEADGLPIPP